MSRIDELIAALCPEGVGFKTLGEIFDMKAGKFISSNEISKNQDEHFLYPCYGGNGIRGFVRQNNQEGKYILNRASRGMRKCEANSWKILRNR
ncbi:hypothetical protein D934_00610 [Xylella fastidiosa subsp. sandyi Ann-1]|uniref:Restriction endonuclease subunit S n=1 Tax=Xylella fastidiosa subsp. sandyi Ann-1 TaxID=155920 RepID=A0A060H5V7_XYLFS|nr:hypothetical protein D934_00610 [Xylella fastidiosa subsp. sandyi Ann-1]